jgi:hypothetical protein
MMTHQAGVRTVVAGGRPTTGPMQAASGARGARVYSADDVDGDISFASSINSSASALLPPRNDTGIFTTYAGFNLRDQIRLGDPVPLQFKYEAADCRIYYTVANVYNLPRLWNDTARAIWEDTSLCVADSTGYPTARNDTSSTKSPPADGVPSPSLDYNGNNHVDFVVEDTGGLPDGRAAARNAGIVPCNNGLCADNVSVCSSIVITCQTGAQRSVPACLPPCDNRTGKGSCAGADTFCSITNKQDSKVNTLNSKSNVGLTVGSVLRSGLCMPNHGTPALGCPVTS